MSDAPRPQRGPGWSWSQWALGAFFAASGLLSWWLLDPETSDPPSEEQARRLPDYIVTAFTALETDEAGRPKRRLVADELRQFVAEDLSELDQPRITLYQENGEPWQARAATGLILPGGEEIQLEGNVELERDGNATDRATHLETELLRIFHTRGFAETDRAIQVSSEQDRLIATGMRLWYDDPVRALFDGRAHIYIAPEQTDTP
ncbi:LPS export ABC transporter periplasmic protein LptC [Thiocapsa imhoffii]|uniref:LPS export ABC transporter periplasmic protein LptC n=1 Tax=Thiocapsa imhoffii TaxID=382777 RepID=A0A9X0WFA2_9GAMM|nr:LPS export ABC transporter periplasmic protein LptC [Thiocapsa imhoffii]MBK1643500.1 LPS export ABC transporter periplasmic protein LptC [Thiocapsa imhoffii]